MRKWLADCILEEVDLLTSQMLAQALFIPFASIEMPVDNLIADLQFLFQRKRFATKDGKVNRSD